PFGFRALPISTFPPQAGYTSRLLNPIRPTAAATAHSTPDATNSCVSTEGSYWPWSTNFSRANCRSGDGHGSGRSESKKPEPYNTSQNTVMPKTVVFVSAPIVTPHDTMTASTGHTASTAASPPV